MVDLYYARRKKNHLYSHIILHFIGVKCLGFAGLEQSRRWNIWTSEFKSQSFGNSYMTIWNIHVKKSGISSEFEYIKEAQNPWILLQKPSSG